MEDRPTINEIEDFLVNELGLEEKQGNWYELIPVEGEKGFEFYLIAIFSRTREDGWMTEDISLSVYWPQTEASVV